VRVVVESPEFELEAQLRVANSRESVVLGRIDSDPEFRVAGKIEVLRRIVFVKSGLRIKWCGSFTA
jgi:hypothetical protein